MSQRILDLIERRKRWIAINQENGFEEGIKNLLTDLYPDSAHFVFELLQNAEDAKATVAIFRLLDNSLEFEHNGSRLFSIDDVESITSIGRSCKKDDPTNIGKFGVGFKSVYSYTLTPEVISGDYHFQIHDLVVPNIDGLESKPIGHDITRITIPFNNPNKPTDNAVAEVTNLLNSLNESTLLFLSNIERIEYSLPNGRTGYVEREDNDDNIVQIKTILPGDNETNTVSYYRFRKDVEVDVEDRNKKICRISIAFKVEKTPANEKNDYDIRWKIKQIDPGRVSIYFPADKETSNLKFHINAPFASTVARDSVRDCEENKTLRDQIATLVVESLFFLRDNHLLTVDFLSVLPNSKDELPSFYRPILSKLVEAFKNEDLTPMKMCGHAAASGIFRGTAQLSSLITDEDLIVLLNDEYIAPMWVANAPLRNSRSDDFLSMLEITEYKISDLITALSEMPVHISCWLKGKSNEWHQQLYAMLADFIASAPDSALQERIVAISKLKIIRLTDDYYEIGKNCFFPDDSDELDKQMPRVNRGVYSSGTNKAQQDKARLLLEKVGVRVVGETEQIETLLRINYSQDAVQNTRFNPRLKDIKRFIRFVEKEPSQAKMFEQAYIFKCENGKWCLPRQIYLDAPYLDTGLSAFYAPLLDKVKCWNLSNEYKELKVSLKSIGEFAQKVGAVSSLEIIEKDGYKSRDYKIEHISYHLDQMSFPVSKLIWAALLRCEQTHNYSCYNRSEKARVYYYNVGNSEFINLLSKHPWVPQQMLNSGCTFVTPQDADSKQLPDGFTFDNGWYWLKKTSFGSNVKLREDIRYQEEMKNNSEVQQNELAAKRMGFSSSSEAMELAEAKKRDPQGFTRWLAGTHKPVFPKKESLDPVRRSQKIDEGMADAQQKKYEQRTRSARVSGDLSDVESYLRLSYSNEVGQLICQICKDVMPFKKRNEEYYMEKVEIFTKEFLSKEHNSHYLALCPLCSAKYKEYVKTDTSQLNSIRDSLLNSECHEIPIRLDEENTIKFVDTHFADLRDSMIGESKENDSNNTTKT
ncbi:MAG: hypothetical protein WC111_03625 [Candidatus Cloacimonadaceae bacterium]|nr:hypothetical protein [Candidatus Cloacimonadota bacterium]MCB5260747.1 hypothetical protein [Candidatus Cloacimonadota bacterium]